MITDDPLIKKMINGEEVRCPKCKKGFWHAIGDDTSNALAFQCDYCGGHIILDVTHDLDEILKK